MAAKGLRYGTHTDGHRYVARDLTRKCQHAVWNETKKKVVWHTHNQGGTMSPFLGPDDVYAEITAGGQHLWDYSPEDADAV